MTTSSHSAPLRCQTSSEGAQARNYIALHWMKHRRTHNSVLWETRLVQFLGAFDGLCRGLFQRVLPFQSAACARFSEPTMHRMCERMIMRRICDAGKRQANVGATYFLPLLCRRSLALARARAARNASLASIEASVDFKSFSSAARSILPGMCASSRTAAGEQQQCRRRGNKFCCIRTHRRAAATLVVKQT